MTFLGEEDVVRLDVSMGDPLVVKEVDGVEQLGEDDMGPGPRKDSFPNDSTQKKIG